MQTCRFLIQYFIEKFRRSENKWTKSQRLNNPIDLTTVKFHELKKYLFFQILAAVELEEWSNLGNSAYVGELHVMPVV